MPNRKQSDPDKGSGGTSGRQERDRSGSYSPEWIKKSRDDVPQTGEGLSNNPVAEAILTGQPVNEQGEQTQPPAPQQSSGDSEE